MDTAADAWLRWTRAGALATVAVLVAVWAHVGADGRLPSAPALLLVVAAMTAAVQPLLARPASAARVVLLTVGGQAAAHVALSLSAGHRGDAAPSPHGPDVHATAASHAADAHPDSGLAALEPLSHLVDDLAAAGLPMVLTHLAAAALVGAWLAAGERAVWTLLTLAWRALALVVGVVHLCPTPRQAAAPVAVAPRLMSRVTAGSVVRRGPPSLLAA